MTLAVDIIKESEGLRLKSYRDVAANWTIGWGHTKGVTYGMTITEEQAEDFLREDMDWVLTLSTTSIKVPLNKNQHAAIASLIFNIGASQWNTSTALRRLNAGNYAGAAEAMTWFNKSRRDGVKVLDQGLVNRRERERTLFLTKTFGSTESVPGPVYGGEAKPMYKSKTQWWAGLGLTGVLAKMSEAFANLNMTVPELAVTIGPLALLGLIFAAIMLNRYLDSRKGVH